MYGYAYGVKRRGTGTRCLQCLSCIHLGPSLLTCQPVVFESYDIQSGRGTGP